MNKDNPRISPPSFRRTRVSLVSRTEAGQRRLRLSAFLVRAQDFFLGAAAAFLCSGVVAFLENSETQTAEPPPASMLQHKPEVEDVPVEVSIAQGGGQTLDYGAWTAEDLRSAELSISDVVTSSPNFLHLTYVWTEEVWLPTPDGGHHVATWDGEQWTVAPIESSR